MDIPELEFGSSSWVCPRRSFPCLGVRSTRDDWPPRRSSLLHIRLLQNLFARHVHSLPVVSTATISVHPVMCPLGPDPYAYSCGCGASSETSPPAPRQCTAYRSLFGGCPSPWLRQQWRGRRAGQPHVAAPTQPGHGPPLLAASAAADGSPPRVLGVDDFAFRKRHSASCGSGTMLPLTHGFRTPRQAHCQHCAPSQKHCPRTGKLYGLRSGSRGVPARLRDRLRG